MSPRKLYYLRGTSGKAAKVKSRIGLRAKQTTEKKKVQRNPKCSSHRKRKPSRRTEQATPSSTKIPKAELRRLEKLHILK